MSSSWIHALHLLYVLKSTYIYISSITNYTYSCLFYCICVCFGRNLSPLVIFLRFPPFFPVKKALLGGFSSPESKVVGESCRMQYRLQSRFKKIVICVLAIKIEHGVLFFFFPLSVWIYSSVFEVLTLKYKLHLDPLLKITWQYLNVKWLCKSSTKYPPWIKHRIVNYVQVSFPTCQIQTLSDGVQPNLQSQSKYLASWETLSVSITILLAGALKYEK